VRNGEIGNSESRSQEPEERQEIHSPETKEMVGMIGRQDLLESSAKDGGKR
jgi:hypothetical protein